MNKLTLLCLDGTDCNCEGEVPVQINVDVKLLTVEQVELIEEELQTFDDPNVTKAENYDIEIELTDEQVKLNLPDQIEILRCCCGACGSDYTYDDEGEIICD